MAVVRDTDKGMLNIQKMLKGLRKTTLSVGVFSDAVNSTGKNTSYAADYAITNEYGDDHVPERSFMRSTLDEKQEEWSKLMGDVLADTTDGKRNIEREIYKIGAIARKDIIAKIDSNINPPNAPSTLKKKGKGKNKTLIDQGVLRNSIEARIGKK
jgi:hypothetical protein